MPEIVRARGHEHVTARHESTLEITTDDYLTPAGDCILGINADRAPSDFSQDFIITCQTPSATITVRLEVDGYTQTITGAGHSDLTFASNRSCVARTSTYVDDRTICVNADTAAADVADPIIKALQQETPLTVELSVDA